MSAVECCPAAHTVLSNQSVRGVMHRRALLHQPLANLQLWRLGKGRHLRVDAERLAVGLLRPRIVAPKLKEQVPIVGQHRGIRRQQL